jgi:hypothetical protein
MSYKFKIKMQWLRRAGHALKIKRPAQFNPDITLYTDTYCQKTVKKGTTDSKCEQTPEQAVRILNAAPYSKKGRALFSAPGLPHKFSALK